MTLSKDQLEALELLKSNKDCFITGAAGTGKTYLVDYYTKHYCSNKTILKCCFTALAVNNLTKDKDSDVLTTIHDAFNITGPEVISKHKWIDRALAKNIAKYDIVIIDEISMVRIDIFEYVIRVLAKALKYRKDTIQLILVGDFYQLPPIVSDSISKILNNLYNTTDGFAFESEYWNRLNLNIVNLKQNFRQTKDKKYLYYLDCIRTNSNLKQALNFFNKALNKKLDNAIGIYPTNYQVDKRNKACLKLLKSKEVTIHAYHDNDIRHDIKTNKLTNSQLPCPISLSLKPKALVMFVRNDKLTKDKKRRFVNGDLATVVSCCIEEVVVKLLRNKKLVHLHKYNCSYPVYRLPDMFLGILTQDEYIGLYKQYPLVLAYGLTIHKAQGKTLDNVIFDPIGPKDIVLNHGLVYTALSRVRSLDNLSLDHALTLDQIKANDKVIAFNKLITNTNLLDWMK